MNSGTSDSGGKRLALIVEDEWLVRMMLVDSFATAGWDVIEAASGEGGAALVAEYDVIDLLVTDIRLTGEVTGWDVAEIFRSKYSHSPVIYASGNTPVEARLVSASAFLSKPVLAEDVLERARQIAENLGR